MPEILGKYRAANGPATILIVEDEQLVFDFVYAVLEQGGYQLIGAHRPDEALRLAAEYDGQLDLAITDVVLEGMDGCEMANRLLVLRPDISVVFMSGYLDHPKLECTPRNGPMFLHKPFRPGELLAQVELALCR